MNYATNRKKEYRKILENIKNIIEKEDRKFRKSKQRKLNNWIISRYKRRMLKTIFGIIWVKITMYKYKENGKWKTVMFENEYLKTMKNCNLDKALLNEILQLKGNFTYKNITKLYPKNTISLASISNIFSKFKPKNDYRKFDDQSQKGNVKNVYIEIDDAFFNCKINNKKVNKRVRMIVMHSGKNNKNQVMNKTIIHEIKDKNNYLDNQKLTLKIQKIAREIYGPDLNLIVIGDGAKYMKTLASSLGATFILDKFHLIKNLFSVIGYNQNNTRNKAIFHYFQVSNNQTFYSKIKELIENNQWNLAVVELENVIDKLKKITCQLISKEKIDKKIEEILSLIKYIKSNHLGLEHFNKKFNIGSRTEAFVSHTIKKIIKKKFSLYSLATIKNLLFLANKNDKQNYILLA